MVTVSVTDSTEEPGRIAVVAAAIVDDLHHPTKLLAARRTEPEHLAGGWEFPGGKIDPGEEAVAALHREIFEELGVRVQLGAELLAPVTVRLPAGWPIGQRYAMRVWWAVVTEGTPAPIEAHDRLAWLDLHVAGEPHAHHPGNPTSDNNWCAVEETEPIGIWDVPWLATNGALVHAILQVALK